MGLKDWGFGKKSSPDWPIGSDGEPVNPAFLTTAFSTDMEAEILLSLLESFDIPVATKLPGDGSFGRIILGMSGTGSDIYVPETNLDEAKNLLEGYEEEEDDESVQDRV